MAVEEVDPTFTDSLLNPQEDKLKKQAIDTELHRRTFQIKCEDNCN